MSTTSTDMAPFMISHLQNGRYGDARILDENTAKEMKETRFRHHPRLDGMAYGFAEQDLNGERTIQHGGNIEQFHAMLALLIGCGLRRGELLALTLDAVQLREERWVIADVYEKAGHVCTVPIPSWVKASLDAWTTSAGITAGHVFRAINKVGRVWGDRMTPKVIWRRRNS